MLATIDIKKQNKETLKWILHFDELRKSYISSVNDFAVIGSTHYTGMPKGNTISNPTAQKSMTLLELERQKLWLIAVESMEQTLSEKRLVFLQLRRRAETMAGVNKPGRPGWMDYVQARYAEWHWRKYGQGCPPDKATMSRWMREIIDVTARIAVKLGVL